MSDRPNALAADSHSYLLLANCIPLETQDPDDTFVYGARVYNSQYQLHTSPIEQINLANKRRFFEYQKLHTPAFTSTTNFSFGAFFILTTFTFFHYAGVCSSGAFLS